ncbi:DUF5994 family protein [Streptomyces sp. NPDC058469]|uniref:DUF5994 family protein n=1 Tax=Streptomyces sp. NPDC058469 TaxID=3346514 RepID=UPI0036555BA3
MTAPVSYTPTPEDGIPEDEVPKDEAAAPALRMSLAPLGSEPALLDGAWWPRSRDLGAELPALVAVLDSLWGRITRVTVNPTHWPAAFPRKVPVDGHIVKVGWFLGEQDPHQLLLLSYRTSRWDLLVVPPETDPTTAAWLMTAASDPLRTSTGSELVAEAASVRDAYPISDVVTTPS